jgi:hypothetical protein
MERFLFDIPGLFLAGFGILLGLYLVKKSSKITLWLLPEDS